MLVVTRKPKQSIMIGKDIEVVILECKDGGVKIGIDAPKDIKVYRRELFDEIACQNNEALVSDAGMVKIILQSKGKNL